MDIIIPDTSQASGHTTLLISYWSNSTGHVAVSTQICYSLVTGDQLLAFTTALKLYVESDKNWNTRNRSRVMIQVIIKEAQEWVLYMVISVLLLAVIHICSSYINAMNLTIISITVIIILSSLKILCWLIEDIIIIMCRSIKDCSRVETSVLMQT